MPHVILVATHADSVHTPRDNTGQYVSDHAQSLCSKLAAQYQTIFHIHSTPIVLDSHQANSQGIKILKNSVQSIRNIICQVTNYPTCLSYDRACHMEAITCGTSK